MNVRPTRKEIEDEIQWLEKNREKIPKKTEAGDSNHDAISVALKVLKEDMDGAEDSLPPSSGDSWGGLVK